MRFEDFAASYDRLVPEPFLEPKVDDDLAPLRDGIREGRRLAAAFGTLLHDRLAHGAGIEPEAFTRLIDVEYKEWSDPFFEAILGDAWVVIDAADLREGRRPANGGHRTTLGRGDPLPDVAALLRRVRESAFHATHRMTINAAWHPLLLPERRGPMEQSAGLAQLLARRSQIALAQVAITYLALRNAFERLGLFEVEAGRDVNSLLTGILSEIDVAIALKEPLTERPGFSIVTLTAPPQFESFGGTGNSDFLVLDLDRDLVRGIQVKTSSWSGHTARYDPQRVTLVHTTRELGDRNSVRRADERVDATLLPYPGALSARFVGTLQYRGTVESVIPSRTAFAELQQRARELLPSTIPDAARRARVVAEGAKRAASPRGRQGLTVKELRRRELEEARRAYTAQSNALWSRLLRELEG